MESVLIVGGAGFIGSHLARHYLAEGRRVHLIVRPGTSLQRLGGIADKVHLHTLQLNDREALDRCLAEARPQAVVHLAVTTRRKHEARLGDAFGSVTDDLLALLSVLAAAAEAQQPPSVFIRTGSLAAYGRAPTPHREHQREMPQTVYAAGLVAGTHYVQALQSRLPFPVITARLSLTYGPGQSEEFLIPSLIRRCLAGERVTLHHPAERRDLLYVDDAVDALCRLAEADLPAATIINVASGTAPTMRETAMRVADATGADPSLIQLGDGSDPDSVDLIPSPALARELLGWTASVSLKRGIERTVEWWRSA